MTTTKPAPAILRWLLLAAIAWQAGCSKPPQFGRDESALVFSDALWTAVTARDMALVDGCEQQLDQLRKAQKLSVDLTDYLQQVIGLCREKKWDAAREKLKWLIDQQSAPR
jgi:hypothetical protein